VWGAQTRFRLHNPQVRSTGSGFLAKHKRVSRIATLT
jgi:hypothetical protein